ncbi:Voltage-dependent calcium channel unc-36 [Caenorhabditis elegans]|uniref:Voltage-dependent calcium channel unc-36 n=1 Tax=Caenorhabditis elegans TaxID=6239 RepID=G4S4A1_CAEEL|nr:VWFA domain-containing protein [Caenorhabditis elegans]CCD66131.1 VWFA domain-containing protein [Caenorhabditis elegans]|eukprot:NP_001254955.1 Voltage-dependent calcium channel unc-36 [Caenorhabditis elegans]
MRVVHLLVVLATYVSTTSSFNKESIKECAKVLSEHMKETFSKISHETILKQNYEKLVEEEQFDPRAELKKSKHRIEDYLKVRSQFAYKAKISLEARSVRNDSTVNDPQSKSFIRFMSAKQGNDGTTIYESNHLGKRLKVNETKSFNLTQNANFYTLPTSSVSSAVHIPTPLYDRNEDLLRKIDWSDIDAVYRTNREETKDLAFQLFCSEAGYMRYYPAASWFWDNQDEHLDLFDCRNTEWYINSATNSKNVLIMLDMSGSMLGQRYEVAKQTTEAILETLSHNDYFNIMTFSKNTFLLDGCNGTNGLLQATMRNKKALRRKMDTYQSEGKAEYEKALPLAFSVLLDINNGGGDNNRGACENVIMLITDGAPNAYKKIFDMYNADKKVRVFTFLVGDEAIDFNEVREMACNNRGYMVHVANMADVDEKIHHYIRRMSRVVGRHYKESGQLSWWTGVYRERLYLPRPEIFAEPVPITNQSFAVMNKMASRRKIRLQKSEARSRMFVTTVSYPVIVNETFMGVAAVNIPLTEVAQKSHPANIGSKSYFFMLDQNGFVMTHPQLRPIDPFTKYHKQNYNNMDLLELEVGQNQNVRSSQKSQAVSDLVCESGANYAECVDDLRKAVRKMIIDCDNSDVQQLDVLYATELLDRVYPQTNTYYAECINHANFVLGLAVAKGDDYRVVKKQKKYDFGRVKMDWMGDKRWRLHPHWRYCFLNDTDTHMSKEEAFEIYAQQMSDSGKAPLLCEYRRNLVEKLLLDMEATSNLIDSWDTQFNFMKNNLIHLAFFATPSGMIRYYNLTLQDYDYIDPYWSIFEHIGHLLSIEHAQESYNHFITDLNRKSTDDRYYRRAVRMKDTIMFDVSNNSKIWYKSETQLTGYGLNENLTMLGQAFKAIYLDKAVLGVSGFEFAYDHVVDTMAEHGCPASDDRKWCVLLDEHAYVFFSNQNDISYEDYLVGKGKHISQYFGGLNRIAQRAMALLVENKFYTKLTYTDNQAVCKAEKVVTTSGNRLRPFYPIFRFLMQTFNFMVRLASQISGGFLIWLPNIQFTEAYTASFHEGTDVYPCPKQSSFYFSNKDGKNRPGTTHLVNGNRSERPCKMNAKCSVKMEASFVDGTNLVMVWITQDKASENCYDESECSMEISNQVPFGFEEVKNEETCEENEKRKSKANDVCYSIDDDDSENERRPCSTSPTIVSIFQILFGVFLHFCIF